MRHRKHYLMLFAVILAWGIDPIVNSRLYEYFSAAVLSSLATLTSALLFLFLARSVITRKNLRHLRATLPACLINSLACVLQRIGLQYTTPARYAFFEHLSCVAVPIILFVCFRKKPRPLQLLAAVLCLLGCLLLAGDGFMQGAFCVGDVLCILAGIMLGLGIVFTERYTKETDIRFFMAVHMSVYFLTSASLAVALNFITVGGVPMESFKLTLSPLALIFAILFGLLTVGLCWMMRNEATRHLNPTVIAVFAPLSAVVTAVISVILKLERATPTFLLACVLILAAALLSGLSDVEEAKNSSST